MAVFDPEVLEELLWRFRARHISRREFLSALGTGGVVLTGSSLLAACGGSDQQITPAAGSTAAAQGASTTTTGSSTQAAGGATTAAGTTASGGGAGGDTITLALQSDITSMDPHANVLRDGIKVFYHMFDNLGVRDYSSNQVGPWLATKWESDGDTKWNMTLRDDVKFHNGDAFTANTVKFNVDRVINPDTKSPQRGNWEAIDHIEIQDDTHITWVTKKPYPVFSERLQNLQFLSEKVVQEKGDAWVADNAIGTGPYKFVSYKRGQEIVMVRNDDYWGPKPAFKNAVFRIIPDIATQIAELLSGRVDIVPAFPLDQIDSLEKSGQGTAKVQPILRTAFRGMDMKGRSGPNPFQEKAVREAVNYACNVQGYTESLQKGGDLTPGMVSPLAFGYDDTVKPSRTIQARRSSF